jgi:hypothetical protein
MFSIFSSVVKACFTEFILTVHGWLASRSVGIRLLCCIGAVTRFLYTTNVLIDWNLPIKTSRLIICMPLLETRGMFLSQLV